MEKGGIKDKKKMRKYGERRKGGWGKMKRTGSKKVWGSDQGGKASNRN